MAEIGLDRSGIDVVVGQLEAASMPEHVRVDLDIEARTSIFQYDAIAACSFWSGGKAPLIVEFRPWQIVFGIPATATAARQGPSNERPRLQGLIWGVNMNRNGNQASYRRSYSPNARPTATIPRPAHLTLVNGSTPQSLNVSSNVF